MKRIYQGRVIEVEILKPGSKNEWVSLVPGDTPEARSANRHAWQVVLWQHHELFQDAVNYYTLALAAMAMGVDSETPEAKALRGWAAKVRETWQTAKRKAEIFDGPQKRLASILQFASTETDFDSAAKQVMRGCPASPQMRGTACLRLLQLADEASDLSVFAVDKLAWLCDPDTKKKTDDSAKLGKRHDAQLFARRFHEYPAADLKALAAEFSPSLFVQSAKIATGREAKDCLTEYFETALDRAPELSGLRDRWLAYVANVDAATPVEVAAKRYQSEFPLAVLFKHWPDVGEVVAAFKRATIRLAIGKDVESLANDPLRELRTPADLKAFDYFTNQALFREPSDKERAAWFEFDLAAFVEAIKSPHRYFQDSLTRQEAAQRLRLQRAAMEGKGREASGADDTDESLSGFYGDTRIGLLKQIVQDKLAWLADAEGEENVVGVKEYTIRERTVRGFAEIKRRWRAAAEAGQATEKWLLDILAEEQTEHRNDFGSATFYGWLAKPEYHPIWRDAGSQPWHADDPLAAWLDYKELQAELADKERPIRFTPAHPKLSPRFFIFPKKSEAQPKTASRKPSKPGLLSRHEPTQLSFTAGIVLRTERGLMPTVARIHYAAPRLCRDQLRSSGDDNLYKAPWLQPMMAALELDKAPERVNFANCRITLQPDSESNIQLTFPVEVNTERIEAMFGYRSKWNYQISGKNRQMNFAQFNYSASEPRRETSLRWPSDIHFAKEAGAPRKSEPVPWHEKLTDFRGLATDLGQRDAGAFARLLVRCDGNFGHRPTRFIGPADLQAMPGKQWRAALERSGLFRLPGEDAVVWRECSKLDERDPDDSGQSFDFREELWGERGRPARDWEADDTADLMRALASVEKGTDGKERFTLLPDDWRNGLSFPEQNDKLLVVLRRYQSRIARLHRWCWFLRGDDKQQGTARKEIAECDDPRLVTSELKEQARKHDPCVQTHLESQLRQGLDLAPGLLVRLANRILALRGRSWHWEKHPAATENNPLHHLTQGGPSLDSKERPVWLRGQRGLSLERIEQIEERRKRFQSLNQTLRRTIGGKPPIRRDESVPDPCPDLLDKLDSLNEQRVNQTAHMILAEALGLRLAPPPANKKALRKEKDQHGVYEKILDRKSQWIGPVDFIVIEDLSRYRTSQGRAPRENSRLMKWCHRAVRDKLKQLCEVFGLPVLETPAAYSSRFCSRSGVPGFRAAEVIAGFTKEGQWAWLAGKKDDQGNPKEDAQRLIELDQELVEAQAELECDWLKKKRSAPCPTRTLLVPMAGGPVFVPVMDKVKGADINPAIVQADINAAINLALRAIADPRLWTIHPRLRSLREGSVKLAKNKKGKAKQDAATSEARLLTREKRKFGEAGKPLIVHRPANAKPDDTRQPNFFADLGNLGTFARQIAEDSREFSWLTREWTSAEIPNESATPPLLHSKSFWGCVKAAQWKRVGQINAARLKSWRDKRDEGALFKE